MRIVAISSAVLGLGLVMGCSQPEPEPVMPERVYDKYGNQLDDGCSQTAGADCDPRGDYQPPSTQRGGGQGGGRGGAGQGGAAGAAGNP